MTAPDPGLTELVATHTLRVVELNEAVRYPECNGCDWVGGLVKDHAAHVASLAAQHFSGRMAELEAERDQAIAHDRQPYPTAWAYEQACAAIEKHRKRADGAEAELEKYRAEERRELEWARNRARDDVRCPRCDLRYGERDQYGCVFSGRAHEYDEDDLRAALKGKQQ